MSACAIAAARYQRGTKISARSCTIALTIREATCSGPTTIRPYRRRRSQSWGKALRVDEPRVDRVHVDPARPELSRDRSGKAELRVLGGRVGADCDRARDRDDVHEMGRRGGLQRG